MGASEHFDMKEKAWERNSTNNARHLLQEEDEDGNECSSLLLQSEEWARSPYEQFGVSVRHVFLKAVLDDYWLHGLAIASHQVIRPRVLACHLVPNTMRWKVQLESLYDR